MLSRKGTSLLWFLRCLLNRKKAECGDPRTQKSIQAGEAPPWVLALAATETISQKYPHEIIFKMSSGKRYALRFVELED